MTGQYLSSHNVVFAGSQQLADEAVLFPGTPTAPDMDVDVVMTASFPETTVPRGRTHAPINEFPSFLDASLPQPFPLPPTSPLALPTPLQEERPLLDLTFAGAIIPSIDASLPTPTIIRTAHNLRLPSFDVLGIAAPHPDRISLNPDHSLSPFGAGPLSKPEDPLHALSPPLHIRSQADTATEPCITSPKAARAEVEHSISTFTPPTEPGTFSWGSFVNVKSAGVGSPPRSESGASPNLSLTASTTALGQVSPIVVPIPAELSDAVKMAAWIDKVKNMTTTESRCLELDSVKILSHALPCPSTTGHLFGQLIATVHDSTPTKIMWINVFHAVPGRYTLSDLPRSPPSTPGPAVGGDNYFTSKVFDSAVAIPDYQLDSMLLPPAPRPVVPPGSINISVVERYIPPTNTNEYAEMFNFRGRSLLYDRLIEISPNNGTLLFVYPTKTGGRTFMQQYLGPILDPLLRTLTVVHELHSELGRNLGQMSSVNYLDEYDNLELRIRRFCDVLNENGSRRGPGDKKLNYNVIHAAKEEIVLQRLAWADDWWVKQEKSRVRDIVTKYFRKTKKLPTDNEMTSAHLIQEVLEGVSKRDYHDEGPRRGVEVGVFIIKKTYSV